MQRGQTETYIIGIIEKINEHANVTTTTTISMKEKNGKVY